jgi:hypothetical protein
MAQAQSWSKKTVPSTIRQITYVEWVVEDNKVVLLQLDIVECVWPSAKSILFAPSLSAVGYSADESPPLRGRSTKDETDPPLGIPKVHPPSQEQCVSLWAGMPSGTPGGSSSVW